MPPIYEAAWERHLFLSRKKIPYVVLGGIAVQKWGQPRLTKDVDLTISVPIEKTEQFIDVITQHFKARVADLQEFARQTSQGLADFCQQRPHCRHLAGASWIRGFAHAAGAAF
jgi:hypothetical protein